VIVASSGNYDSTITDVVKKTDGQQVSITDNENSVKLWTQIYGIDISTDKIKDDSRKRQEEENVSDILGFVLIVMSVIAILSAAILCYTCRV
jgi:hypothetical protein